MNNKYAMLCKFPCSGFVSLCRLGFWGKAKLPRDKPTRGSDPRVCGTNFIRGLVMSSLLYENDSISIFFNNNS